MDVLTNPGFYMTYAVVQAGLVLVVIRFMDFYERESIGSLALMALWGATGASLLAALGNQAVLGSLSGDVETVFGPAISAPVVEELAKGIALLAALALSVWLGRRSGRNFFDGPTDGLVYGAAIGLGFSFTEDFFYFAIRAHEQGTAQAFQTFLDRRDFFGPAMLHHPVFTAAFGAGLGLATWAIRARARALWAAGGLLLAMTMHAVNNGLAELVIAARYGLADSARWLRGEPVAGGDAISSSYDSALAVMRVLDYVYIVVLVAAIVVWLRYQRRVIASELADETWLGERADVKLLLDARARLREHVRILRGGNLDELRRQRLVRQELTELAFMKWQRRRNDGDEAPVRRRRRRIRNLLAPETTYEELQAVRPEQQRS